VLDLAERAGVEMPITDAVVQVLHEGLPVDALAGLLLGRPRKAEGV
jgi:glycerol-3-phosphate dehydrogenase (NAD(P)+)